MENSSAENRQVDARSLIGLVYPIPINLILLPKGFNAREVKDDEELEALTENIRQNGLLQNLTVRLTESGTFKLLAGFRRYHACKKLGMQTVPCLIRTVESDLEAYVLCDTENLQRQNLTLYEQHRRYKLYELKFGLSATEIAKLFQKNPTTITNYLSLSRLHPEIMKEFEGNKLKFVLKELLQLSAMPKNDQIKRWRKMRNMPHFETGEPASRTGRVYKKFARRRILERILEGDIDCYDLSPSEKKAVCETIRWVIGVYPVLPFKLKKGEDPVGKLPVGRPRKKPTPLGGSVHFSTGEGLDGGGAP